MSGTERTLPADTKADPVFLLSTELGRSISVFGVEDHLHIDIDNGERMQWYVLTRDEALKLETFIANWTRKNG